VTIAGRDAREYRQEDVRRTFALAGQEAHLFSTTIRENLRLARTDATDDELWAALRRAHVADWVESLPDRLDTYVGEDGSRLSGGQRQRVAIARAIYKDAPILILDEATSALDTEAERAVQAALEHLMQGKTTLVIAHRLSTIERADRIVVLSHGKIMETGSHQQLLDANGAYANLHRLQFSKQVV